MQNFAFMPADITVKKGTTVTWTNNDSAAHTVTAISSSSGPSSGTLNQGDKYTFTFNTAGMFHYRCSIHPDMLGTVTVTE
ncbi:cupredoxin domain-containing protein [Candidatus Saccharibacteria bacterium]|nr:cupredoxin domain-containing protein [Candidatus Saccharibacteria bacterium]